MIIHIFHSDRQNQEKFPGQKFQNSFFEHRKQYEGEKNLRPGGVFIFTTGGLDTPQEKTDSAMGPKIYYSVLGIPKTLSLLTDSGCVCRHLEYDQFPEQHVYIIAQKA